MIHSTSSSYGSPRTNPLPPPNGHAAPTKKTLASESDTLSASHTESVRRSLESTPEIRPEMVELGERLAVDPNYPPREIIEQLARMFTLSQDPSDQA